MAFISLMGKVFSSKTKKAEDGRDQWPSRASFILAAMGGCVGLGNILRYVSEIHSLLV
jgi:solute carrier family 6 GABA transporter-like protein 1